MSLSHTVTGKQHDVTAKQCHRNISSLFEWSLQLPPQSHWSLCNVTNTSEEHDVTSPSSLTVTTHAMWPTSWCQRMTWWHHDSQWSSFPMSPNLTHHHQHHTLPQELQDFTIHTKSPKHTHTATHCHGNYRISPFTQSHQKLHKHSHTLSQ